VAGSSQPREEHAFAAEDHRLDAAHAHDVVVHRLRKGHEAARVDVQLLAGCELALDQRAARVHEHQPVAFELLHDEALAAEEAREEALLERDADRHTLRGGQERVLLTDQLAAEVVEVEREDRAGVGRRERDAGLAAALVREHRGEQALAREHALAGADEQVHEPAALAGTVPEDRRHLDRRILVHEAAGLRHGAFAGVELDFDELHLVAVNLVVDVVRGGHRVLLSDDSWTAGNSSESCVRTCVPGGIRAPRFRPSIHEESVRLGPL
jgi:hypothetical protein